MLSLTARRQLFAELSLLSLLFNVMSSSRERKTLEGKAGLGSA